MSKRLSIQKIPYGKIGSIQIDQFILTNANGVEIRIINYGGIITHLFVPDREGRLEDVVLGFDTLEKYIQPHPHFGCIIGRYGNRIANGRFSIDGDTYHLAKNAKGHHLHGGEVGFDKKIWTAEIVEEKDRIGVQMDYLSPDGEEGYPGNLKVKVTYTLNAANELAIHYEATTDQNTVVNLTNHSYFNLNGAGNASVLDHQVQISADHITAVDDGLIPTGELYAVENTPLDFREAMAIGERIKQTSNPQLAKANGYDHNYVFSASSDEAILQAKVHAPLSGRTMEVLTSEPATQLYTCNFEKGGIQGKLGKTYKDRAAFCLETQHYPDSPNHPNFPSTILRPDEVYKSMTIYRFK
ncbi:MAG: aldose epimerase family protein [Bacteroidota bacterium]